MTARQEHDEDCYVNALYPGPCRCEEINREEEAYDREPDDMADQEEGID
ncbi:hypothetical protein ACFWMU_37070 [Streptomyces sp. NPDC058357]